jgi:molybdopterin synthase catalytic subunit
VKRLFELRETPLSVDECLTALRSPEMGGIALFLGIVRDHNQGRDVNLLEYQAYKAMAEKELLAIANEIESELSGTRLACLHRTGALAVGDVAVICAAAAPHRGEAFVACRELIDRLKARVPIWKREHGAEGPHWIGWQDVRG